jgi:hypothetical protein
MPDFKINDVLDKTLIARTTIPLYRVGQWSKPFSQVKAGFPVGVLYSWIGPNANTKNKLFLQFNYSDGTTYYAEYKKGAFNISTGKQSGALVPLEQVTQQEQREIAESPTLLNTAFKVALYAIGAWAIVTFASNAVGGKSKGQIIIR